MTGPMPRVALYARYSSDNQRDASIEDQLRRCREYADRQGWTIVDSYSDLAMSGASLIRPGIQELLSDVSAGRFDMVLSEALDRISRDQEEVAAVFKRARAEAAEVAGYPQAEDRAGALPGHLTVGRPYASGCSSERPLRSQRW